MMSTEKLFLDDFGILLKCQIVWDILGGSLGSKWEMLAFVCFQCAMRFKFEIRMQKSKFPQGPPPQRNVSEFIIFE